MVTSIVYTLIGLILCFVLYIAFRAINVGMEAKKANKTSILMLILRNGMRRFIGVPTQ